MRIFIPRRIFGENMSGTALVSALLKHFFQVALIAFFFKHLTHFEISPLCLGQGPSVTNVVKCWYKDSVDQLSLHFSVVPWVFEQ